MATQEAEIDNYVSADGYEVGQEYGGEPQEPYEVYEDDPNQQPDIIYRGPDEGFNLTSDYIEGDEDRRATARAMEEAAISAAKEAERANKEFEKQAVKFAQNKAKTSVKESDEEACKRLADKYQLYLMHFKHFCTKPKLTGKENRKELERLVSDAKSRLDASGMAESATQNWFILSHATELVAKFFGANAHGVSTELMESMGEFEQEIKEMMILWPWLFRRPLLFRFAGKLAQVVYRVHQRNTAMLGGLDRVAPQPAADGSPAYSAGKNRVELPPRFGNLIAGRA